LSACGMPVGACDDKARGSPTRQPAGALVGWCGVPALANRRGGVLRSGVGVIRRASVASGNRLGR
ncbi:hypothetical protein, partial [Escherichia coli]|uniref:hypothetical protein n=1 Tax=Escherichia coli TaxID=562 RepID=UPI001BAEDC38